MREIKFRVWNMIGKSWQNGDDLAIRLSGRIDETSFGELMGEDVGSILQQYTGLLDKNGKEIYEGDIVKFIQWPNQSPLQIVFKDGVFTYDNTFYDFDGLLYPNECEIIGNIFETPDLLK